MGALRLDDTADVAWLLAVQEVVVWLSGLGGRGWHRWLRGGRLIHATSSKTWHKRRCQERHNGGEEERQGLWRG